MSKAVGQGAQAFVTVLLAGWGAWGFLFALYRAPGGFGARIVAAAACGLVILLAILLLWTRSDWRPASGGLVLLAALVGWFYAIPPRQDRDWAPDVSRPLRATVDATRAVVHDVRTFTWRTDQDFTPAWEERSYDLSTVRSVDLVNSYWSGRAIAHTLLTFGFADGRHLAFSAEIRRETTEEYSDIAGFFRQYELVFVAADERDLLGLRTGARGEDVELYRLKVAPDEARTMLVEILRRANNVAEQPAWYNSFTRNCTTEVVDVLRSARPDLRRDWRVVLTGFLPDWAYDAGLLDRRLPFPDLQQAAKISARGKAAEGAADFSALIRDGVPDPNS